MACNSPDRMREFLDPHAEILHAHAKSYVDRYAGVWVLGDRAEMVGGAARVSRQLLDDEQIESETNRRPGGSCNQPPLPHAESKVLDGLLVKGTRVLVTGDGGLNNRARVRASFKCILYQHL